MNVTENRVVRMVFDNNRFKAAAEATRSSLDSVHKKIQELGNDKGLLNLNNGMQQVAINASKMQVATAAAVGTLASKATTAVTGMLSSLTLAPLKQGFTEYEALLTKQNTIMNSTGKSAKEVKRVLSDLNTYSDKTIYSFSDMTSAITKFTNAGVPLKQASKSIMGIANAAAFAGLGSEEAGRAFYAFSQSMSTGYLMLQDWNQLDNAGFGNMRFKTEVLKAAEALGTLNKQGDHWVTKKGKVVTAKNFRNMLQEQFATTEVLNKALSKYSDTTTKLGKKAMESAQEVRTFTAFMGTLKESIGSGWANIFTALFGGLEDATDFWTGLSNSIGGAVQSVFKFGATAIQTWRDLGGFTTLMKAFKNALSPIGAIFKVLGDAWRAAFPRSDKGLGGTLYGITVALELLTRPLLWLSKLILLLVHPLKLFFLIIKAGATFIKGVINILVDFVKLIWQVATFDAPDMGGFWGFVQKVGRWAKEAAEDVQNLFDKVKNLVGKVKEIDISMPKFKLPELPKFGLGGISLAGIFGKDKTKAPAAPASGHVSDAAELYASTQASIPQHISDAAESFKLMSAAVATGHFSDAKEMFESMQRPQHFSDAAEMFKTMGDAVSGGHFSDAKEMFESMQTKGGEHFSDAAEAFNVARLKESTGEMSNLSAALGTVSDKGNAFWGVLKKIGSEIKNFFSSMTGDDVVSAMNFAVLGTIGFMVAKFLWNLTHILDRFADIGKAATEALNGVGEAFGSFQTLARAKLIINIAIAIALLAASLALLAFIPQDKLNKGLKALGGIMAMFAAVMFVFGKSINSLGPANVSKIYAVGFAMAAIGFAILLLATAMLIMKKVGIKEMIETVVLLEFLFLELQLTGKLAGNAGRKMVAAAAAMIMIGIALGVIATSMLIFKLINVSDMVKAGIVLVAMTAALVLLSFVPPGMLLHVGAAMLALAVSMGILAVSLIIFSKVKWSSIAKAAVVLTLLTAAIIAIAIFGGGPVGASAIIALAAGVMILSLAMLVFNKVSWNAVAKGAVVLVVLVAAFALFMGVVYLAAPVIPLLTGLAFGLGALAIGIGLMIAAFAIGLPLLAAGVTAFAVFAAGAAIAIATFLQTLAKEAPIIRKAAIAIFQEFCNGIVEAVPIILDTIKRVLKAIWDFFAGPPGKEPGQKGGDSIMRSLQIKLQEWTPKVLEAIEHMISQLVQKFHDNADNYAAAAVGIIIALINGIASKADEFVGAGVNLVVKLMEGIGNHADELIDGFITMIADVFYAVADGIRTGGSEIGAAVGDAISAFGEAGADMGEELGKGIGSSARSLLSSPIKFAKGLVDGAVHGAEERDGPGQMNTLGQNMTEGVAKGIQEAANDPSTSPVSAMTSVVNDTVAAGSKAALVRSPSKKMIKLGEFLTQGLAIGVQNFAAQAITALASVVSGQIATAREYISKYVQKLDQQSISARAKAEGLAEAARIASDAANKTEKNKKDDARAEQLQKEAEKAGEVADKADEKTSKAKEAANRKAEFEKATTLEKARMKSEDAQRQIDDAKEAELTAARDLSQARALERESKSGKYSKSESDKMIREAKRLRAEAEAEGKTANALFLQAKKSTAEALQLQKKAGAEAAASFQKQFDQAARDAAKEAAFDKLTDEQKAVQRRKDAKYLQEQADANLKKAKVLAFSDIEAANELAQKAMDQAEQSRQYLEDAAQYEEQVAQAKKDAEEKAKQDAEDAAANAPAPVVTPATSIDLTASDAAAVAFNNTTQMYNDAMAAASAGPSKLEFNQYNTSPEALSPTEVYRQTNNLLNLANSRLATAA